MWPSLPQAKIRLLHKLALTSDKYSYLAFFEAASMPIYPHYSVQIIAFSLPGRYKLRLSPVSRVHSRY